MPFSLNTIQKAIKADLEAKFPQFDFYRSTIPEDLPVPHEGGEVNPFFVLQFGKLYTVAKGKSFKGVRNDEFSSWVEIIGMGSVEDDVSNALDLPVDYLIGYKTEGSTKLVPDGGVGDYSSRQYAVRPVLYYMSQRFVFNITQNGVGSYLSP